MLHVCPPPNFIGLWKNFQAGGRYKTWIKPRKTHIHHRVLSSVAPIEFHQRAPNPPEFAQPVWVRRNHRKWHRSNTPQFVASHLRNDCPCGNKRTQICTLLLGMIAVWPTQTGLDLLKRGCANSGGFGVADFNRHRQLPRRRRLVYGFFSLLVLLSLAFLGNVFAFSFLNLSCYGMPWTELPNKSSEHIGKSCLRKKMFSCARGPPQFSKKRSENGGANENLSFGFPLIPGIALGVAPRIMVLLLLKSWDDIPRMKIFEFRNGISNSESCSENTPELSESSENGLFPPRAFSWNWGGPQAS